MDLHTHQSSIHPLNPFGYLLCSDTSTALVLPQQLLPLQLRLSKAKRLSQPT